MKLPDRTTYTSPPCLRRWPALALQGGRSPRKSSIFLSPPWLPLSSKVDRCKAPPGAASSGFARHPVCWLHRPFVTSSVSVQALSSAIAMSNVPRVDAIVRANKSCWTSHRNGPDRQASHFESHHSKAARHTRAFTAR
jgi:hypothetical protein